VIIRHQPNVAKLFRQDRVCLKRLSLNIVTKFSVAVCVDTSALSLRSGIRQEVEGKNVLDMQEDVLLCTFWELKVIFSNLSLNERCLSASLVCKYWRDLCLDFQFWKQLDLSSRQQVTDELLEKIASRSQNITEINISDCRNVSDTGVSILACKCPGLLRGA
ncbi:hypothetical protein CIB84_004690, partial [Bambusicola thoracicus]